MADAPPHSRTRAPRRDAQARRAALITAAADRFATDGYDVPLEAIADQAGVGRGTLYRNFRDREALAIAIFSREIDRLAADIDPAAPIVETLAHMVRERASASLLFSRIAADLHREDANLAAFRSLGERLERVVAPAVAAAKDRDELAPHVTAQDFVLAVRMAGGILRSFMSEAETATQISAAMRLLFEGLRPR